MSAPSIELFKLVPFAVLGASLLGSAHCVAMCGGLVISVGRSRASVAKYHSGRLVGYLTLGTLAGRLGEATLSGPGMNVVSWVSVAVLAASFVYMGVSVWRGKGVHLFEVPRGFLSVLYRGAGARPLAVGLLSALLPCGWLHGFVLAAVATQGALPGALLLLMFWAGTLPALTLSPWFAEKVIRPCAAKAPKAGAILLFLAGVSCLAARATPLMAGLRGKATGHCHEMAIDHEHGQKGSEARGGGHQGHAP